MGRQLPTRAAHAAASGQSTRSSGSCAATPASASPRWASRAGLRSPAGPHRRGWSPRPCRRARRSAASCSASTTRLARSSRLSMPQPGDGSPARQRAYSAGCLASMSVSSAPCHSPKWRSRRRGSGRDRQAGQRRERRRRVVRTGQVAADQDIGMDGGQQGGGRGGLVTAARVQGRVGLALNAAARVVVGVAVPPDEQSGHSAGLASSPVAAAGAAGTRSRSTNGMVGQSFHNRSSE